VLRGWPFELACVAAAAVCLSALLASGAHLPATEPLVLFFVTLVVAANAQFALPSAARISPCFMAVLAAIAAFGTHGAVIGASLVGIGGGLSTTMIRKRRYTTALFDCAQYLLASAAAAALYVALHPVGMPAAFAGAVIGFAVVNVVLVLVQVCLNYELAPRTVWRDMFPELPNYLAFGLLGVFVGWLYSSLGAVTLPLLIMPLAITRKVFASFLELREAHEATVRVFIRAIEAKDEYTAGHTERVAKYAIYIGEQLKFSGPDLDHLRYAALLHDVGKLAVPRRILNKPGRLTEEEYAIVQRHNHVCIEILTRVDFMRSLVGTASDKHAHFAVNTPGERDRLVDEAHIVAVADAFDAMTSTRSYRRALSQEVAFAELRSKAGTQFNPECVQALIHAIERRGERYGLGYEEDAVEFDVPPPVVGVGSAGLGDLVRKAEAAT